MTLTEHMIDTKLGCLHVEVDGEGPAAVIPAPGRGYAGCFEKTDASS
jgi:hypothetical protein